MESKTYLIFSLHGLHYGVDALLVQEIFQLPELAPISEAPDDIVGILNLRGKVVPVMHLDLRLGHQFQECCLSDSVVVLKWEGLQIGIIVNQVHEVKQISLEAIAEVSYGRVKETKSRFITDIAKVDTNMIMLVNHQNLLCDADITELSLLDEFTSSYDFNDEEINLFQENQNIETLKRGSFYDICCPNATPREREIFCERAKNLRQRTDNSDFNGLIPLAVIGLNDEYFGLNLQTVREFSKIRNITPIPCCPDHIIGNINLRGEIVTLVDIRKVLNMPLADIKSSSKAIVIQVDDIVAGLHVDEVFDVMYLQPSSVTPVPTAAHSSNGEYLRGNAPYQEKMLSILDLSKILVTGGLIVNEEV